MAGSPLRTPPPETGPVAVIGAGWAGLAAALQLVRDGLPVVLVEAGATPGGRARSLDLDGAHLDNGQHILVGACRQVLEQMRAVGVDPESALQVLPFALSLQERRPGVDAGSFSLAPRSTRPWHLAAALYRALGGETPPRRLAALFGAARMLTRAAGEDLPVAEWLRRAHQPPGLIARLWEPLCLAIMNTPVAEASTKIFQNVLRQTLLGSERDARLLIPRMPLGALFPEPALARLRAWGAEVRMSTRVTDIANLAEGEFELTLRGGDPLRARQVILATAPRAAARLLPECSALAPTRQALSALGTRSICTVYLRYPKRVVDLPPLTGLLGQHGQWLLPRHLIGEPHWVAVVISAAEMYQAPDARSRWRRVAHELSATFPTLGHPDLGRVVCEHAATFDARAGIDDLRPGVRTGLAGLYLAGDHCAHGLPSTLEAAVQGGLQAATAARQDTSRVVSR
ncbi:MAG: hydroxysqualene dehydroxylase HpnE [Thioalkalivibrio sp.]|nr:hydroxysqualene dehydroxylase HpnE [Thioalkalivibrio sp.]